MKLNELIENIGSNYLKPDLPLLTIGNFISVDVLIQEGNKKRIQSYSCLLYTSPSPRDLSTSRMPSSA